MVSKPDPATTLTLRGPSSVVSRRPQHIHSRSRRYNRSHAGGASYAPRNEFPVFSNSGDVEILVRAGGVENRYLLHRHTLTRCSGFFEASTSSEWSRARTEGSEGGEEGGVARIGEGDAGSGLGGSVIGGSTAVGEEVGRRQRWRYELDPGTEEGDVPMLIQKDADDGPAASLFGGPVVTNGAPRTKTHPSPTPNRSFFRSVANLSLIPGHPAPPPPLPQADEDLLRDYDNLLRIFYNYPPLLDGVNIADAYVQCKALLSLADQYDALAVAGPRVDHHLLQFQSRLWRQIAKYPASYLRLAYLARSKVMFQEALVHVVGQWPVGERSLRAALPGAVLDVIEDKVDELEERVSRVEARLFRLNLCTPRGERVSPANSYLDWLAVSLFRQWLADNTTAPPTPLPPGPDGAKPRPAAAPAIPPLASLGRTFRTLGSAHPGSYLAHDECKRFLKLSPESYSRENLRRFEGRLAELKGMAREIVGPLMGSGLEMEVGGGGGGGGEVGYLTCTTVRERDLPWE